MTINKTKNEKNEKNTSVTAALEPKRYEEVSLPRVARTTAATLRRLKEGLQSRPAAILVKMHSRKRSLQSLIVG